MASNISVNHTISLGLCAKDTAILFTEQLLSLFYILSPLEHTKDDAHEVPNYEVAVSMVLIEFVLINLFCS